MRKIPFVVVAAGAVGGVVSTALAWRRNPRLGTRFVNTIINPALLGHGLVGAGRSELGTLEHVGRRSGTRRLTPVHPEFIPHGIRIMVPLGSRSQWAQNVLAAGHCRLQSHGYVFDLDEPRMVPAAEIEELPPTVRRIATRLGFEYLLLRRFAVTTGFLAASGESPTAIPDLASDLTPEPEEARQVAAATR